MNCKPGDMAIVVSGFPRKNIGKIVVVTTVSIVFSNNIWRYEGVLTNEFGLRILGVADECLRPLRDTDGQDETLTWRDVPTGVAA